MSGIHVRSIALAGIIRIEMGDSDELADLIQRLELLDLFVW